MNFYKIKRGIYKRLYNYFSDKSCQFENRQEVKKIIKNLKCKPLSKSQKKEIKDYYASFGFTDISTDWHRLFSHVNGKFHKEYIPHDFFYNVIEPSLNMRIMFPAMTDKNILDRLFTDVKQPETVVKNINGIFQDGEDNSIIDFQNVLKKCKKYTQLVIKPSIDSGGGKNISIFNIKGEKTDLNNRSIEEIIRSYNENFIIQNYFTQHEQMSKLNPSSVNTLRITTLLIDGKVEILDTFVRIGGEDSKLDNINSGGFYCFINSIGLLNKNGFDASGRIVPETSLKIKLEGFKIPYFRRIIEDVKDLHIKIPRFKMVSWDISIDEEGRTVLIEYNVFGQGIGQEMGPLFGKFTDEILRNCKLNKFSF